MELLPTACPFPRPCWGFSKKEITLQVCLNLFDVFIIKIKFKNLGLGNVQRKEQEETIYFIVLEAESPRSGSPIGSVTGMVRASWLHSNMAGNIPVRCVQDRESAYVVRQKAQRTQEPASFSS